MFSLCWMQVYSVSFFQLFFPLASGTMWTKIEGQNMGMRVVGGGKIEGEKKATLSFEPRFLHPLYHVIVRESARIIEFLDFFSCFFPFHQRV